MRALVLVLCIGCSNADGAPKADFASTVKPLLEKKCQPCHFTGGKMYDRLPFDRAETIRKLGEKLFTRIREEPDRAVIRAFLAS